MSFVCRTLLEGGECQFYTANGRKLPHASALKCFEYGQFAAPRPMLRNLGLPKAKWGSSRRVDAHHGGALDRRLGRHWLLLE